MKLILRIIVIISLAAIYLPSPAFSQQQGESGQGGSLWTAELTGGEYIVRLNSISSVSLHTYVVDNVANVHEVVIASNGPVTARFYFLAPISVTTPGGAGANTIQAIQSKLESTVARTPAEHTLHQVVKNYPATTHAHTVEFRLPSQDSLEKLYESLKNAWLLNRGDTYRLK